VLDKKTSSERVAALSDGVFAVILTIIVLDLKPPAEATLHALVPLWPVMLSYAVGYLFISIIWANYYHLLRFVPIATPELIWWNFAHRFMVSLIPATTAWMAATKLAAAPVLVYALVFVLVEIAYVALEHSAFAQATEKIYRRREGRLRVSARRWPLPSSCWLPRSRFRCRALVCCVLLIYLSPRLPDLLSSATH
jgi:uncharacterized membrane protein